jgi:hypothetical protein
MLERMLMEALIYGAESYEPPAVRVVGSVAELTQWGCQKKAGGSDGFIFQGNHLVCKSG